MHSLIKHQLSSPSSSRNSISPPHQQPLRRRQLDLLLGELLHKHRVLTHKLLMTPLEGRVHGMDLPDALIESGCLDRQDRDAVVACPDRPVAADYPPFELAQFGGC